MSDPFSRLGSLGDSGVAPDLDAIRLRAHRLRRRRQTGLAGAGAAAMAILAVVGVLLATGPGGEKATRALDDVVQATSVPPSPQSVGGSQLSTAEDAEAAKSVPGNAVTSGSGATTSGPAGSAPSTKAERSSGDSAALAGAPSQDASSPLKATLEVSDQMIGRGKTFTLKVCNVGAGTVTRDFGSSQRYDFEVSRGEEIVWRWSDGQFFTQVVGSETWKASECKEWSADWDGSRSDGGRAPAGDHEAIGVLKASPELRTSPEAFSLSAI